MTTDRESLAAALRRMADDLAPQAPPAATWDGLRARLHPAGPVALPALATPAPTPRAPRRAVPVVLGVAALLLTSLLLMLRPTGVPTPTRPVEAGFVPVVAHETWPAPGAAWLVRGELPRERLAEFGLPFDPTRADERVPAQLLLRPDGAVLAVRVLAREHAH